MFESLVVDLVNKYLGNFVENLDKSQLHIGLWAGLLKELLIFKNLITKRKLFKIIKMLKKI